MTIRSLALGLCLATPMPGWADTSVSVALDWMLNTNHVGLVVARDQGFYAAEGLEVELLPYSDTNSAALLAGCRGFRLYDLAWVHVGAGRWDRAGGTVRHDAA
ncbi:ABC transporter substrate-binding protein [Paracoccus aerius]|uniref:ABC transporter substrate-binding protein n=1 Tax=Paracoccus aerius TaxID=1915382 RepID=UPI00361FEC25